MAPRGKASAGRNGRLKEAVATAGIVAILVGAGMGAYLGFGWGGLGAAFIGALVGGTFGFGVIYAITNVIRQNSQLFKLLLALIVIGGIAWALHMLGGTFGFNPK